MIRLMITVYPALIILYIFLSFHGGLVGIKIKNLLMIFKMKYFGCKISEGKAVSIAYGKRKHSILSLI